MHLVSLSIYQGVSKINGLQRQDLEFIIKRTLNIWRVPMY